jgi:hypothetical protein
LKKNNREKRPDCASICPGHLPPGGSNCSNTTAPVQKVNVQSFKVVAAVAVPVVQNVQIVPGFKTGSENFHVLKILATGSDLNAIRLVLKPSSRAIN